MWHDVQVFSTKPVHNLAILGDWVYRSLKESKSGHTYGIGNKIQRDITGPKVKSMGSEITEIHQFQYRAPQKQENSVYLFFKLHKSCLKNQLLKHRYQY